MPTKRELFSERWNEGCGSNLCSDASQTSTSARRGKRTRCIRWRCAFIGVDGPIRGQVTILGRAKKEVGGRVRSDAVQLQDRYRKASANASGSGEANTRSRCSKRAGEKGPWPFRTLEWKGWIFPWRAGGLVLTAIGWSQRSSVECERPSVERHVGSHRGLSRRPSGLW